MRPIHTSLYIQLHTNSKYSPTRPICALLYKQLHIGLKYSLMCLIHASLCKQLTFSHTFSPVSCVRLNFNTALFIKQVTSLQYKVQQFSVQSKGDSSNTGESENELDYGDDFDLTAALQAREEYFQISQWRYTKENPPKRHKPIFALYRSILLVKLITNSSIYKGHFIDLQFDRFLGLIKGMIKKAQLKAISKQSKAIQKKANYIPDLVSAYKVFIH